MTTKELVKLWFSKWKDGDFTDLPIADDFRHTSPYGTIASKAEYTQFVADNEDKFLGHEFEIHGEIYDGNEACVRYTAVQGDFRLEVSEWHVVRDGKIAEIIAYYNIGDKPRIVIPD